MVRRQDRVISARTSLRNRLSTNTLIQHQGTLDAFQRLITPADRTISAPMPRPKQIPKRQPLSRHEIDAASYRGSKEHKAKRWWGGLPGAKIGKTGKATRPKKQKTTICWLVEESDRVEATRWVQHALTNGQYRYYEADDRYPKHIWYEDKDGQFWFGFLFDSGHGSYKGWPIDESEKIGTFG